MGSYNNENGHTATPQHTRGISQRRKVEHRKADATAYILDIPFTYSSERAKIISCVGSQTVTLVGLCAMGRGGTSECWKCRVSRSGYRVCLLCENPWSATLLSVFYFSVCMFFFHDMYKRKGRREEGKSRQHGRMGNPWTLKIWI